MLEMGFWDWFKSENKEKKEEKVKISLDEIGNEIKKEKESLEKQALELKKNLRGRLKELISNLRLQVIELKATNIEGRKEEEKIKILVRQNLKAYISQVEGLISYLEKLDESPERYILAVSKAVENFNKSSRMSFEKATILIGKLEKTRELIRNFLANFKQMNLEVFSKMKKLEDLTSKKGELDKAKETSSQIKSSIENMKKVAERGKLEKEKLEEEFKDFKASLEYKKHIEEKENTELAISKLNQDIFNLKEKIDFRDLLKRFHADEKKSRILRNYNENFLESLKEDENFEILKLIPGKFMGDLEKIKENSKILEKEKGDIENKQEEFEEKIKSMDFELINREKDFQETSKKLERIMEKESELLISIKSEGKSFGLELE
jgi:hypothetical protein